jgi:hypothetical protein
LNPHQRYLALLDATSVKELEDRIVSEVQNRIRERQSPDERLGAVRLSRVVDAFDIEPTPQFDPTVPDGRLHYDRERGRFVITLRGPSSVMSRQSRELFKPWSSHFDNSSLTRRLRFTYAHEVAHRFCFLRKDGDWTRAIEAAIATTNRSARFGVLSRLELGEERLCDRVAGRLLIPEDVLTDFMRHRLSREGLERTFDLYKELAAGAKMFQVSLDCLLVAIQRAVEAGKFELPANLCAFLVRPSDRMARTQIAPRKLRIRTSLLPARIGDSSLKRIHPGLGAENLGTAFSSWISGIQLCLTKNSGGARLPIILHTDNEASKDQEFTLNAWWKLSRRKTCTEGILIWGFLDSPN